MRDALSTGNNMRTALGIALLALALLFAIVACSDDSGSEPSTASTASEPTQAPSTAGTETKQTPATAVPQETEATKMSVVTTTNIMADWVSNVGGDNVDVFSLVPVGADPHTFQPGAKDVARIAEADLVLSVGLGLEGEWLHDLLESAARDESSIIEMGEIVDPIEFAAGHADEVELLEAIDHIMHEVEDGEISPDEGIEELKELLAEGEDEEEGDHEHEGEEGLPEMVHELIEKVEEGGMTAAAAIEAIEELTTEDEHDHMDHGHGLEDPHFWFDPLRVKIVVNDIAARLSVLNPQGANTYVANAIAYNAQLDELHSWTEQQVEAVSEERRLLVTSHDSFGYFANLYHFEVVGVVLSTTTDVEPSAGDLAELVHEVEENNVPAVFGETTVSERLAKAVATESGAELVRLYSGSLGPEGSGAATYIEMVRTNVDRMVQALK